MVAAATMNPKDEHSRRPPLLPSERDYSSSNGVSKTDEKKKPKSRIVSSRYMSPSASSSSTSNSSVSSSSVSSRRFPSPLVARNGTPLPSTPSRRSVSVDRRRPVAARPLTPDLESKSGSGGGVSAATKLLVSSTRSLSVSFQGEAFALPISKTRVSSPSPNLSSVRKGTPERRRTVTPQRGKAEGGVRDQVENSKLSDQHRWPARNRSVNSNSLSRSMDCSGERMSKMIGSGNFQSLQQSMMMDDRRRPSIDGRLSLDLGSSEKVVRRGTLKGNSVINGEQIPSDRATSDSDSVSSGSASEVQECNGAPNGRNGSLRSGADSARFWQETNSRLRRLQDPGSPRSPNAGSTLIVPPKSKRYFTNSNINNGSLSSPRRTMSSPIRGGGGIRPASPSKIATPVGSSPSRGASPSRMRNVVSTINNNFNETPSVLSYAVDVRRGKVGENRIVDAHLLRLVYNRQLQWRFVNARTETVLLVQKRSVQKNLWNAWITISDLRDMVTKKRHRLQLLRQKLKLASILKVQMTLLEDWASLDKDHSISLLGATEALMASTFRLPVVDGATADVQSLQDAIFSAVDIMKAMTSSLCLLLPTVEEVNSLLSELAKVTKKEQALLEQCTEFISLLAAMKVKDSSLRTHILQHNRVHKQQYDKRRDPKI